MCMFSFSLILRHNTHSVHTVLLDFYFTSKSWKIKIKINPSKKNNIKLKNRLPSFRKPTNLSQLNMSTLYSFPKLFIARFSPYFFAISDLIYIAFEPHFDMMLREKRGQKHKIYCRISKFFSSFRLVFTTLLESLFYA